MMWLILLSLSLILSCVSSPAPVPVAVQQALPALEPLPGYSPALLDLLDKIQPQDLRVAIKRELVKHRLDDKAWEEMARGRMGK